MKPYTSCKKKTHHLQQRDAIDVAYAVAEERPQVAPREEPAHNENDTKIQRRKASSEGLRSHARDMRRGLKAAAADDKVDLVMVLV